jgi:very-short-patch-repair endonuclease
MELMLIIEVDGITHHWEETIIKDKKKQDDLEALVIRSSFQR